MKTYLFRQLPFLLLSIVLFSFGVCVWLIAEKSSPVSAATARKMRPDLSYQIDYQDADGVFYEEIITAEGFLEAVEIAQKIHPDLNIVSVNRRSFVYCSLIKQK